MSLRNKRLLLWITSAVFLLLAAVACLWAFLPLSGLGRSSKDDHAVAVGTHGSGSASIPPYSSFVPLMELDLRQSIEDVGAARAPTYAYKLTGTIMEPGNNVAMFQGSDGSVELKAVGEKAGDAEVLEIQEDKVVVFYGGQKLTLKIEGKDHP